MMLDCVVLNITIKIVVGGKGDGEASLLYNNSNYRSFVQQGEKGLLSAIQSPRHRNDDISRTIVKVVGRLECICIWYFTSQSCSRELSVILLHYVMNCEVLIINFRGKFLISWILNVFYEHKSVVGAVAHAIFIPSFYFRLSQVRLDIVLNCPSLHRGRQYVVHGGTVPGL